VQLSTSGPVFNNEGFNISDFLCYLTMLFLQAVHRMYIINAGSALVLYMHILARLSESCLMQDCFSFDFLALCIWSARKW